jgi:hypothetical protein
MTTTTWIVLGAIALLVIWVIILYNGLVARRSRTSTCSSSSATTWCPIWSRR